MNIMEIGRCVVGDIQTNCFLAMNRQTKELLIIDPGDQAGAVERLVKKMGGIPAAILLTHGHFDHFLAADELKKNYSGLKILAPEGDRE